MEDGDLVGAAALLDSSDVSCAPPDVRAIFRHTSLSLGWRLGDRKRMREDLDAIDTDTETPPILKEIARVLLDASPFVAAPAPLPAVAKRLREMAAAMAAEKLTLYSAIALHDSTLAYLNAGDLDKALEVGSEALERFGSLTFFAVEQLSTHTALAVCEDELGHQSNAEAHRRAALVSGREMVDVPAELARLVLIRGDTNQSHELIARAQSLQRQNQSDAVADGLLACSLAVAEFRTNLPHAIELLRSANFDNPMELGYALERDALLAQALLLEGSEDEAVELIARALKESRTRGARRAEVRLAVLNALVKRDKSDFDAAVDVAHRTGALAILELADVIVSRIGLLAPIPEAISKSIADHPRRWLPVIRRRLDEGGTPEARIAAALLDDYGTVEDVGRLRAYAKTYVKRGPSKSLGRALARRTSPLLQIRDLGPVTLAIEGREVRVATIRRKSAAVLMYLVTRPRFSANREQAIDALWPEADPESAINNLNQALFFLRRQVDPWYEDDLSVDYIELQGDLVWLDADLVRADSAEFLEQAQTLRGTPSALADLVIAYQGQFAPEFEYEDWALPWRGRVHATFLDIAHSACDNMIARADLAAARDLAGHVLRVDPAATDIEIKLIWIYGRLGMVSAANSLYGRLKDLEDTEGLQMAPLSELLRGPLPTHS
jgi:DNA-binding SARP family transcriptional activator